jgi:ABC-type uncharacterized transport system substrate-binding protein
MKPLAQIRSVSLAAALVALAATGAAAHPHVWVTLNSSLVFAPDGTVTAVRHAWTFDEMFSAFATQGLDKDNDGKLSRDELKELAEVNVTSLEEFNYFSVAKSGGKDIAFDKPKDYWLEADKDNVLTLHFTLPLKSKAAKGEFTVDVYDPTFFVDLSFADNTVVKLDGAPAGCAAEVKKPQSSGTAQTNLSESFFNSLSASSQFGSQFANRITLRCK